MTGTFLKSAATPRRLSGRVEGSLGRWRSPYEGGRVPRRMEEVPWEGSGILETPEVVQAMLVNLQNKAELYGTLFKPIDAKCRIIDPSFLQTHTHTHTPHHSCVCSPIST